MIRRFLLGIAVFGTTVSAAYADKAGIIATESGSLIRFSCPSCKKEEIEDQEPIIEVGNQEYDVREIDGAKKLYRTENWLGGSPVSYVHIPITQEEEQLAGISRGADPVEAIDGNPVASIGGGDRHLSLPVMADIAGQHVEIKEHEIDPAAFELRLE